MLNDDEKLVCDNCEEVIGDSEAYFVDGPKDSGDFCSWACIMEYASEFVE